jgi:hypothetical protein
MTPLHGSLGVHCLKILYSARYIWDKLADYIFKEHSIQKYQLVGCRIGLIVVGVYA